MPVYKIRASALKSNDVILGEKDGYNYRLKVLSVEHCLDKPKKVMAMLKDEFGAPYTIPIPWDRRHTVERSGGPSEAPRTMVEATTPTNTSPASPGAPAGDSRVAALIAEAREEFITKVRKIIRDGYAA